jgi:AbrB family looped-hinge helix DNA binding protein
MAYTVGTKGQVVIAKEIRETLGVKPGWIAVQRLAGDHVEIYLIPPEHRDSLKGTLKGHIKTAVKPGKEWDRARDLAWKKAGEAKAPERKRAR